MIKKKKEYVAPEELFDVDDEATYGSLHPSKAKKGKKEYTGKESGETLDLGGDRDVAADDQADAMSDLSGWTNTDIKELLRHAKGSKVEQDLLQLASKLKGSKLDKGSDPKNDQEKSGLTSAGSEDNSSKSDSSDSSAASAAAAAGEANSAGVG